MYTYIIVINYPEAPFVLDLSAQVEIHLNQKQAIPGSAQTLYTHTLIDLYSATSKTLAEPETLKIFLDCNRTINDCNRTINDCNSTVTG